tara:strand:- start:137 stop:454 length:318 start_codon:yes stop_codon:yes gene_type:complete
MKKIILFLVVVLVFVLISCSGVQIPDDGLGGSGSDDTTEMSPSFCEEAGGKWNECGSPCAGTDAEICATVCSPQCECGGIAGFGCPENFECKLSGKVVDEIGVCV